MKAINIPETRGRKAKYDFSDFKVGEHRKYEGATLNRLHTCARAYFKRKGLDWKFRGYTSNGVPTLVRVLSLVLVLSLSSCLALKEQRTLNAWKGKSYETLTKVYGQPAYWQVIKGDSVAVYPDTAMASDKSWTYYFETAFYINKKHEVRKIKNRDNE